MGEVCTRPYFREPHRRSRPQSAPSPWLRGTLVCVVRVVMFLCLRAQSGCFLSFPGKTPPWFRNAYSSFSFLFHVFISVVSVLFPTEEVCKFTSPFVCQLIVQCSSNYYYVHIAHLLLLEMHNNGKEHCCIVVITCFCCKAELWEEFSSVPSLVLVSLFLQLENILILVKRLFLFA